MKTEDDHFSDWLRYIFRFDRNVEVLILPVLKKFIELIPEKYINNYEFMEKELGKEIFWLLITLMREHDIIYLNWFTEPGLELKKYFQTKILEDLIDLVHLRRDDDNYLPCFPKRCHCESKCHNSFWLSSYCA